MITTIAIVCLAIASAINTYRLDYLQKEVARIRKLLVKEQDGTTIKY